MSNTAATFHHLLTGYKKSKTPLTLYMFAQADPLFGRVTEIGKDYIRFTNIPEDQTKAITILVPLSMICGLVPASN